MPKFYGMIGYGETVDKGLGNWEVVITEYPYFGDVVRNSRKLESGDKVNNDLSVGNSISIVADAYAEEHFHEMKYVHWAGARWLVSDVEVRRPRLVLRLGGLYNGPTPDPAPVVP